MLSCRDWPIGNDENNILILIKLYKVLFPYCEQAHFPPKNEKEILVKLINVSCDVLNISVCCTSTSRGLNKLTIDWNSFSASKVSF